MFFLSVDEDEDVNGMNDQRDGERRPRLSRLDRRDIYVGIAEGLSQEGATASWAERSIGVVIMQSTGCDFPFLHKKVAIWSI